MPEVPPLPDNLILLVEVGSTAHGTGLPGHEDHDEIGVVIERPTEVFGVSDTFGAYRSRMERTAEDGERSTPSDTDRTLHSLRKFLYLATYGNPSILMVLWAPVLSSTYYGIRLQQLGPAFVGRHVIPRYRGYMREQGERMLGIRGRSGHGRRGGGQRTEVIEAHGYDTKFAMHCARLGFQGIELVTTGRLALPIEGEPAEWLRAVRHGNVPFEEWWDRCIELDRQLGELQNDERYRPEADRAAIEALATEAHLSFWQSSTVGPRFPL